MHDWNLLTSYKNCCVKLVCKIGDKNFYYQGLLVDVGEELLVIDDRYNGKTVIKTSCMQSVVEVKL